MLHFKNIDIIYPLYETYSTFDTLDTISYILKRNGFFFFGFFCLSGNYFETGKGYKLEILQEGVV